MIRDALRGRKEPNPEIGSLILVYTLSKALGISPLEVYKMPVSMVKDLLSIHFNVEKIKSEEFDKAKRKAEGK
tara:strand:- start:274 stop:492 length:219 start_codon:yes stop_codon:yes gene_type:complete